MICIIHISSRFITGYIDNNMQAINSIKALDIAFKVRNIRYFYYLIHHSDKGSQYYSKADITTLQRANIPNQYGK